MPDCQTYLRVFVLAFAASIASVAFLFLTWFPPLASIPLGADPSWYRDYGGRSRPDINDHDLFYHAIGDSVASAKASDIVILGPSFTSAAFSPQSLQQFTIASGLKVYNMSFGGVRGGEFSRRVIKRWRIHAPLWIINVDDQSVHFFSRNTDWSRGSHHEPIDTLRISRPRGYLRVLGRNLRWRLEDAYAQLSGDGASNVGVYRSSSTGDVMHDFNVRYNANDNPALVIHRDQTCHADSAAVEIARQFLRDLGGVAVFILVPHSEYCTMQARELGRELGVEVILAPPEGYTSLDNGGHLDNRSAVIFTDFVMSRLVETAAFARAFGKRRAGPAE
jgi:hypothetical protein